MSRLLSLIVAVAVMVCVLMPSAASAELVELNPSNYDTIVNNPKKNVFVMFYATWCGHCNSMKPAWKELADSFPISGDTVIARVDASTHKDIAKANSVRGFPTLKFFSKTNKAGVEYSGPREVSAFKLFIKNGSN